MSFQLNVPTGLGVSLPVTFVTAYPRTPTFALTVLPASSQRPPCQLWSLSRKGPRRHGKRVLMPGLGGVCRCHAQPLPDPEVGDRDVCSRQEDGCTFIPPHPSFRKSNPLTVPKASDSSRVLPIWRYQNTIKSAKRSKGLRATLGQNALPQLETKAARPSWGPCGIS